VSVLRALAKAGRHPLVYLRAVAATLSAARRVARLSESLPFDDAVAALRQGRIYRGRLKDPRVHLRVTAHLASRLPPRNMGACLRRSLILLHLWSRCGLRPKLHLGFRLEEDDRFGHAWVTLEEPGLAELATASLDYPELFVFFPNRLPIALWSWPSTQTA